MSDELDSDMIAAMQREQALQELYGNQHMNNLGRIDYQGSDKYMADEVNYTSEIIKDEIYAKIEAELEGLMLKKRTLNAIKRVMLAATTQEIVINNYTQNDIMGEKIGVRKNTLFIMAQVSGVEKKYCDVDSLLIYNVIHHRTKVYRGRQGFERESQKSNILKSHVSSDMTRGQESEKTGISRVLQGRKRL